MILAACAEPCEPPEVIAEANTVHFTAPFTGTCTDGAGDVLRVDGTVAHGFLAATAYTCTATCGASVTFETAELPATLPAMTATGETDGFTLFNHLLHCTASAAQELVIVDPQGRIRWHLELPTGLDPGVQAAISEDGHVVWGGGGHPGGAPRIQTLGGETLFHVMFRGSDAVFFHHEGRIVETGDVLALAPLSGGGFRVMTFDVETGEETWYWDSDQGVAQGVLPTGEGDIYHANWADIVDGVLWVSLCAQSWLIGVDTGTGTIEHVLGEGGNYTLTGGEWFQCQHGLEIEGDRLLAYDNGVDRESSWVREYRLDFDAHTAEQTWAWGGTWYESTFGDADWIDGGVLVNRAHSECVSTEPGTPTQIWEVDRGTGEIVWSLVMDSLDSASYRAERVDPCRLWDDAAYCDP